MEKIFIYGLFRDQAKNLLGKYNSLGRHSVSGKIYKVNEFYPGFKSDVGKVWGELVEVNSEVLSSLDEYEGHEYERVKIKTDSGLECWIYQYKYDTSNFKEIKVGDWMLR
jgi:gamma-glutamylcyclotransferase (GGCT)/AIG2-like uncharacterized protein YtfP